MNKIKSDIEIARAANIKPIAEVIEVSLDDQGEPWDTKNKPKHKVL